jgi:hypothetical protein
MEPVAERRLRHGVIFAFGLLYLLSYVPMTLLMLAMANPYALGVSGSIVQRVEFLSFVLGLLALGILMLLAIRSRKALHVLALLVLVVQMAAIVVLPLTAVLGFDLGFLRAAVTEVNGAMLIIGSFLSSITPSYSVMQSIISAINAIFWLLPFIVYYLACFLRRKKV